MQHKKENKHQMALTLGALGVVFGDIGTSPLYAMKACFSGHHAIALNPDNILGVVSLIIWSLLIVICLKYVTFVMTADNEGEGGIFALYELVSPKSKRRSASVMLFAAMIGGALLYGDGVITPAISVLSAIEGLDIATDVAHKYTTHIACSILLALFAFQSSGTDKNWQTVWSGDVDLVFSNRIFRARCGNAKPKNDRSIQSLLRSQIFFR